MSERKTFVLISERIRSNAARALQEVPDGFVVTIAEPTRNKDQNARMWAMLSDVADAKPEGRNWTPETWKAAFMHVLGHQVRFCEGLDNSGPFPLGFHSSRLSVREMADLITCIDEYGTRHGVEWKETRKGGFFERTRAAA